MEKNIELYGLIYDYYETRICFGYYRYGDRLPSIPQICENFQMGRTTVRRALSMLEKKGYIRMEARRTAWVSFQAGPEKYRENAIEYFVPRKEGLPEFCRSVQLIILPLWEAGLEKLDSKAWEEMRPRLREAVSAGNPFFIELCFVVLRTLDNGLILNLYWEGIRYVRIPCLTKREPAAEGLPEKLHRNELTALLKQQINQISAETEKTLLLFIDESRERYQFKQAGQVPFRWNIYRQRPQLKYTLAAAIIGEIITGKYPAGSRLPSLSRLEEQYGVSLATVRRAMLLLENLGITRSHQGKGTLVWPEAGKINFSMPEIRGGLRLYLESLQLLALTIRPVLCYTLCSAGEEKCSRLTKQLTLIRDQNKSYYCFEVMLAFVRDECPLAMVRECYGNLLKLAAWGYPFAISGAPKEGFDAACSGTLSEMLRQLRAGDFETLSEGCRRFSEQIYDAFKQMAVKGEAIERRPCLQSDIRDGNLL